MGSISLRNPWDEQARLNWNSFLTSLKSYLETGKGTPGTPPGFK